ncbi:hypothetical protein X801_05712, partial [Opisthorchis viverrini]
ELWQSDLDFIFRSKPLTPKLSNLDILDPNQNVLATSLIALQPPALGGLGQLPQTEQQLEFAKKLRWNSEVGLFRDALHSDSLYKPHEPSTFVVSCLNGGAAKHSLDPQSKWWHAYPRSSGSDILLSSAQPTSSLNVQQLDSAQHYVDSDRAAP